MGVNAKESNGSHESYEGVLPVWKPSGFTSHDVVAKVRRLLGIRRIGHTGTLDPAVTGVLPLCVGRATRVVEYIQDLPKEYEAVLTIGYSTDTEDATGTVIDQVEQVNLSADQVHTMLKRFVGVIEQVPPMYSAVKIEGKRLYELARAGMEVERKPRQVEIYSIETLGMNLEQPHPDIRIRVRCSKGTYIRTLCSDIGRALGYPAVMSDLVRTSTGGIGRERCVTLDEIAMRRDEGTLASCFIPSDEAISYLPACRLPAREARFALQGRTIRAEGLPDSEQWVEGLYRVYGQPEDSAEKELFLGLFRLDPSRTLLKPEKVFT
ncbi:tRNA pseudouridine(55) synthase TruB [Gorillibacterium timonense]|uniref:tRNA pseudouridine(55) synthase TruB n=1 Tax=Gorillibacterium timonense TaxID=1689269 RepID=UPI00071D6CB4|nr:tRNA pseudouridine(55) synthase TruB [Gorillibacterium timonense]